jgi:thioredoxin 1
VGVKVKKMEYRFTNENFDTEVMNSEVPVLIDFYADWCGPCKMMGPVVEELAKEYDGKVKVGKINVDEQPELAQKYGVMSIPYFAFIKNGELVSDEMGAVPKDRLAAKLQEML